ncbi:MAG: rane protein [Bacillales bacterium]|nr:rane protein [Bacillales bacterium]
MGKIILGGVRQVVTNTVFEDISNKLALGSALQVERVFGGYMHKMYSLNTEKGKYAVKLLNPKIMKRPDVFKNFQIAEQLERTLEEKGLPIVSAIEFNGKKMQCLNNQYYYVFKWLDGKALGSGEISKEHCEQTGALLAMIHKIEQKKEPFVKDELNIDWDFYINIACDKCPEIVNLLKDNIELLYFCQSEGNIAFKRIPSITSICNGDMDIKNVLWINGKPNIIDLECLKYGNPYMELFQLALCWSGYEHCLIDYELLETFIRAYCKEYGYFEVDWEVLYNSNCGMLEWLEYNIKRALMIECENEEERKLGIEQVKETISHIIYYSSIKNELLHRLNLLLTI